MTIGAGDAWSTKPEPLLEPGMAMTSTRSPGFRLPPTADDGLMGRLMMRYPLGMSRPPVSRSALREAATARAPMYWSRKIGNDTKRPMARARSAYVPAGTDPGLT